MSIFWTQKKLFMTSAFFVSSTNFFVFSLGASKSLREVVNRLLQYFARDMEL